ncbi:MAG TPA: MBL fold metallo-hydrolase [Terriglobia bacterium]|nr:MBL fold metallo-hydrolase [Terriglobia bacterium]
MRFLRILLFVTVASSALLLNAQSRNLDIYWIDTEGGAATLFVTPSGQSLLVDTGNQTVDDRDAKRIADAAKKAGLTKINFLLTTHFHSDHVGGVAALSKMIPIERYFDHGDSIELQNPGAVQQWNAYKALVEGKRTSLKPGDTIPVDGVDIRIVSSNGQVIPQPINGGSSNTFCLGAESKPPDTTENQRSAGFLLTYGAFKLVDVGDLTWDKEMELACPINKLGTVTLLQATHHGFYNDFSGAPAHVWALKPQVVMVNNGPRKGLQLSAWNTIQRIAGLEGVWQSHLALGSDKDHNTAEDMIANLEATADCKGNWIKASIPPNVSSGGAFTMTNGRNGFSKTYKIR